MISLRSARVLFASGMLALGAFGLVNGDFASAWRGAPSWLPGRVVLAYASATLVLVCGAALLVRQAEAWASRVLFPYFVLVVLLLKVPTVVRHPLVEVAWQSMGEMLVILAGAWVLYAGEQRPTRAAQLVFGFALVPLGLAHFFYLELTAPLVPNWLPYHTGWAYLTGAAQVVAGVAVLLGVLAPLAATLEAAMLTAFTALVWIPRVLAAPTSLPTWSEFTASWAVSAGAWVVAASIRTGRGAPPVSTDDSTLPRDVP